MENSLKREYLIQVCKTSKKDFYDLGYPDTYKQTGLQENFYAYISWVYYITESPEELNQISNITAQALLNLESELREILIRNPFLPTIMSDQIVLMISQIKFILKPDLEMG